MKSRNMARHSLVWVTAMTLIVSGLLAFSMVSAKAHTGDLKVTAICSQQTGTYDLTAKLTTSSVPNGVTGSTKWRIGTSNFEGTPGSASGMDRGPVTSTGNQTITLGTWSLPGTTTGYGPWVYAYTTWSNYNKKGSDGQLTSKLKGDCKQNTQPNPPTQDISCTMIYRDFGRALKNGDHINVTIERANGSQYQVNVYVDRNIAGGYDTLGFRYSDGTTRPLSEEEVKKGRIWLDLSAKVSESYYKVQFVQINESENWPNLECGTVAKDASAAVSTTPPSCTTPEKLVLGTASYATWGTPTRTTGPGSYSVTATANTGHAFSNGSSTKTFTGTLADKLDPNANPDCRPSMPEPKVKHKTDDRQSCDLGVEHREWDLEYPPVWNSGTRSWDWGNPVVKNDTGWVKVRDLTPAELKQLSCDKPDKPKPTVKPLTDDRQSCASGVEHRTGTETTDWVFNENTWTWIASTTVTQWNDWVFVRDLTPAEKQELNCDKPDKPEPVIEPLRDDRQSCQNGVEQRTGTKTTDWAFDENTWKWVAGTPVVQWGDWTFVRGLTAAEKAELGCAVPPPPAKPIKVKGKVAKLDKCGTNNFIFLKKVKGLHYVMKGKILREGKWLKVTKHRVVVKAKADSAKYKVKGKTKFVVKFPNRKRCQPPPKNPPHTGLRVLAL